MISLNILTSSKSEQTNVSWFSKKRIYPLDTIGCDIVTRTKLKV